MFEKSKVYNFMVRELTTCNGKRYFLLSFNGEKSMPEYFRQYGWEYRVPLFPFQDDWEREDYVGKEMPCVVTGFNTDMSGRETDFPMLVQTREPLLKEHFKPGEQYAFIVTTHITPQAEADGMPVVGEYRVKDSYGLQHVVRTKHQDWQPGQRVVLRVREISGSTLKLEENSTLHDYSASFKIGESYDFVIESEEIDQRSNSKFFALRARDGSRHRFYFKKDRNEGPADTITLKVQRYTPKGCLYLVDPNAEVDMALFAAVEQVENDVLGGEDLHQEYKSSFVYSAKSGEPDIDYQLDKEIMKQVAGFMNADGGTIYIGYRDDGTVRGIEEDLPYINSSTADEYKNYDATPDKIALKIMNTIKRKLGVYACGFVEPKIRKQGDSLVCHLEVKRAEFPVFWDEEKFYVRCYNSVQKYYAYEMLKYIKDRFPKLPLPEFES